MRRLLLCPLFETSPDDCTDVRFLPIGDVGIGTGSREVTGSHPGE